MLKISFIVPTLNEQNNIEKTINRIQEISKKIKYDVEIICIDAESKDGTADKLKNYHDKGIVIYEKQKILKGPSHGIMQGINKSQGDFVLIMDADNPVENMFIEKIIGKIDKNKLIIGSRFLKESKITNVSKIKIIFSKLFSYLISVLFKMNVKDTSHSLRVFPKSSNFSSENLLHPLFFWENTIFMKKKGLSIIEIPINYTERESGISKLTNFKLFINTIFSILKIFKFYFNGKKYP